VSVVKKLQGASVEAAARASIPAHPIFREIRHSEATHLGAFEEMPRILLAALHIRLGPGGHGGYREDLVVQRADGGEHAGDGPGVTPGHPG
jgi:hypothetical protein